LLMIHLPRLPDLQGITGGATPATVATKSRNSGVPFLSSQSQMISFNAPTTAAVAKPTIGQNKSPAKATGPVRPVGVVFCLFA